MPKLISACSTLPPTLMRMKGSVRAWTTRRNERLGPRGSFSTSSKPSMAYVVNITSRAERDLDHLYGKINAEHSEAALNGTGVSTRPFFALKNIPTDGQTSHLSCDIPSLGETEACRSAPHPSWRKAEVQSVRCRMNRPAWRAREVGHF